MNMPVVLEPDEDGWVVAEYPALPGCVSQDCTKAETLANICGAIQAWLAAKMAKHRPDGPGKSSTARQKGGFHKANSGLTSLSPARSDHRGPFFGSRHPGMRVPVSGSVARP